MEKLTYLLEKTGLISKYQSGFRKGRGTMDPIVCLGIEIRKAQIQTRFQKIWDTVQIVNKKGMQ